MEGRSEGADLSLTGGGMLKAAGNSLGAEFSNSMANGERRAASGDWQMSMADDDGFESASSAMPIRGGVRCEV